MYLNIYLKSYYVKCKVFQLAFSEKITTRTSEKVNFDKFLASFLYLGNYQKCNFVTSSPNELLCHLLTNNLVFE